MSNLSTTRKTLEDQSVDAAQVDHLPYKARFYGFLAARFAQVVRLAAFTLAVFEFVAKPLPAKFVEPVHSKLLTIKIKFCNFVIKHLISCHRRCCSSLGIPSRF